MALTDIEGVVKEVHLVNPHSWIYMEVKGPDGDSVKVRCHPLRDGSRGCLLGFVKARDGSVKDWDASNVPLPADF